MLPIYAATMSAPQWVIGHSIQAVTVGEPAGLTNALMEFEPGNNRKVEKSDDRKMARQTSPEILDLIERWPGVRSIVRVSPSWSE